MNPNGTTHRASDPGAETLVAGLRDDGIDTVILGGADTHGNPLSATVTETPITPERILDAIAASAAQGGPT